MLAQQLRQTIHLQIDPRTKAELLAEIVGLYIRRQVRNSQTILYTCSSNLHGKLFSQVLDLDQAVPCPRQYLDIFPSPPEQTG